MIWPRRLYNPRGLLMPSGGACFRYIHASALVVVRELSLASLSTGWDN